jgi:hypothetical protein
LPWLAAGLVLARGASGERRSTLGFLCVGILVEVEVEVEVEDEGDGKAVSNGRSTSTPCPGGLP